MPQDTREQEARQDQEYRRQYSRYAQRKKRILQNPSKIDLSKSNENENYSLYNSHLLSIQSQAKIGITNNTQSILQVAVVVVSSVFFIGLLGLAFFKRRKVERRSIPSILLDSGSGRQPMQEGLRVSIESSRSQVPVPDYILPPSPEYDTLLASSCALYKKLLKPSSAMTVGSTVSQESLGRFYR